MKFRLTATAVRVYDVDPNNYPSENVKEMLKIDKEMIGDDPDVMLDHPDTKWKIKVEVV